MFEDNRDVKAMLKDHKANKGRGGEGKLMQSPDTRAPAGGAEHSMHGLDGKHMAAQDMIDAFHAKDPQKAKDAMSAFMDLHSAEGNKPEGKVTGDDL